jgi:Protein of unknown function (DUF2752)
LIGTGLARRGSTPAAIRLAAVLGVGLAADVAFDPVHRHVPLCPFHAVTGWDCPLCGGLRAVDLLAHGDIAGSLRANAVLLVLLPVLAVWFQIVRQRSITVPRWAVTAGVVLLAAFTIMRNLPGLDALRPA